MPTIERPDPNAQQQFLQEQGLEGPSSTLARIALGQDVPPLDPATLLREVGIQHADMREYAPRDMCTFVGAAVLERIQPGQLLTTDAWGAMAEAVRTQHSLREGQAQAMLRYREVPPAALAQAADLKPSNINRATHSFVGEIRGDLHRRQQVAHVVLGVLGPPETLVVQEARFDAAKTQAISEALFGGTPLAGVPFAMSGRQEEIIDQLFYRHLTRELPRTRQNLNHMPAVNQLMQFCEGRDLATISEYEGIGRSLLSEQLRVCLRYVRQSITSHDEANILDFATLRTPELTLGPPPVLPTLAALLENDTMPPVRWDATEVHRV